MRVLIISNGDLVGGASRAAFRLHQALRGIHVESFMAVRRKHSSDPYVHKMTPSELGWPLVGRGYLDLLPFFLSRRRDEPISLGLQSANLGNLVARFKPNVVNLHWINGGIASIRSIGKLHVPVTWTLHDMWPFTGGCHYSGGCLQYRDSCNQCPKIKPLFRARTVTNWVHRRKRKHWGATRSYAITPSFWMKNLALSSSLFADAEVKHIRNCVDPEVFSCRNREKIRHELGLPVDATAILFSGADQPRKGGLIIPEIIARLQRENSAKSYRFLFMGALPPQLTEGTHILTLPTTTDEARAAEYYSAADIYALPSFEDNLPNTISEALNCGTPVVAFPTGGIVEMIQSGINGVISTDTTAASLVEALSQCTESGLMTRGAIAREARATYSPNVIAKEYLSFFESIVTRSTTPIPAIQ
jgi:glycosyltransferase involved in cell wall biosynthesis